MRSTSLALKAYRRLLVCLFICLMPSAALSGQQVEGNYAEHLVSAARQQRLSDARIWRVLLHYPDGISTESLIDDPSFFLAANGKHSPESELEATLEGLFAPADMGDKHPRCRYPARFEWLQERLGIDENRLPHPVCNELETYLQKVNPRSASLMFPSAYMNSPASMFGHTFIRIDGGFESELLGFAVNYAAQTDESNGMVYAWKGIFGLYKGYFSILPQYAKIREYSGLEHRDIWEYRLNLTPEEVRRMALHVWEMREIYSDYFFFDENCSYNLLFLLEAGRPTAELTAKTTPWVIPLDTIALVRSAGLVSSTRYRPSQGRKIRAITRLMDDDDIEQARRLSLPEFQPESETSLLDPARNIRTLDLAVELLQYSYGKQKISQDEYQKHLLRLLKERSRLGISETDPYRIEQPSEPGQGHSSSRISLGGGADRGQPFIEAGVRPAYHSLDDPNDGYLEGAQIQFMNTAVRYYPKQELARLERLNFIDIVSLSEYERIFKRISWKVNAGLEQIQNKQGDDVLAFRVNSGGGIALDTGILGLTYALIEFEGNLGQGLADWYAVGTGFSAGFIKKIGSRVQLHLNGKSIWYPLGEKRYVLRGESIASFSLNRNNSLEAVFSHSDTSGHVKEECLLLWNHYF
jgi:hypothetical protein